MDLVSIKNVYIYKNLIEIYFNRLNHFQACINLFE